MKLIIDIPDEAYNVLLTEQALPSHIDVEWLLIHGIPLDKLREEVMEYIDDLDIAYEICGVFDNIGKADMKTNRKNCEYRHENGNCLKVGGFCTSVDDEHCMRNKIRCNTCKNNDDELSGECYECVKNIQNHYKAESEE